MNTVTHTKIYTLLCFLLGVVLGNSALAEERLASSGISTTEEQALQCSLANCWAELFPMLKKNMKDSSESLDQYIEKYTTTFENKIHLASLYDRKEPDFEIDQLRYKIRILRQYLSECEDLKAGPNAPRHLILSGPPFNMDGQAFAQTTQYEYERILRNVCGDKSRDAEFEQCKRSIVIKDQVTKQDLLAYLRFLGNDSVQSITYIGHGIATGLGIAHRNLLLPSDWSPQLNLDEKLWREKNGGMLYTSDFEKSPLSKRGFEREFGRVVSPRAVVTLFTCKAGKDVAVKLKESLGSATVYASQSSMNFQYQNDRGEWITRLPSHIPKDAKKVRLRSDHSEDFHAIAYEPTLPSANGTVGPVAFTPNEANDLAARSITLRVALGSSDEALVENGTRLIHFSKREQNRLADLLGKNLDWERRVLEPTLGYSEIKKMIRREIRAAPSEEAKYQLIRLAEKLELSIEESVRLYYTRATK